MSSNEYSACLTPDPRLRRIVLRTGHLFAALGVALILQLPAEPFWLATGAMVWAGSVFRQNQKLRRAWQEYSQICVYPDGRVELIDVTGERADARLEDGSILIRRCAWLRLSTAGRGCFAELLQGDSRRCNNWRRLQVIWRHVGAMSGSC